MEFLTNQFVAKFEQSRLGFGIRLFFGLF